MRINAPTSLPQNLLHVYVADIEGSSATIYDPLNNSRHSIPFTELVGGIPPRRGEWWTIERSRHEWYFLRRIIPQVEREGWVGQLLDVGRVVSTDPLKLSFGDSAVQYDAVNASGQTIQEDDEVVVGGVKQMWYILGVLP